MLSLHALPYIVLVKLLIVMAGGRRYSSVFGADNSDWTAWQIFDGLSLEIAIGVADAIGLGIAIGIIAVTPFGRARTMAGATVVGIAGGIGSEIALRFALGTTGGIAAMVTVGTVIGVTVGIFDGIFDGIATGIFDGIVLGIIFGILAGITVGIAFGVTAGTAFGIIFGILAGIAVTRAWYLALHLPYVWPVAHGRWYPTHPVAWDDLCGLPFPRLDRLLVDYARHDPIAARREIERLTDHYPSQRGAALRARTTLIAQAAGQCTTLGRLDAEVSGLPEGDATFLRQTPLVRDMVASIAAAQRQLDLVGRPVLREPIARRLVAEIDTFSQRVAGLHEPLASGFRAAARNWRVIAERQWREAEAVVLRDPTPQVFRAGDPADVDNEAFIERTGVIGDIAAQLELATGCPGLVLYGRRRTGKSTILRNLPRFLGPERKVASISMQEPKAFTSLSYFVTRLAQAAGETVPEEAGLPDLFDALTRANQRLGTENQRLLLAIDEYEAIDQLIGEGVFPLRLLDTVRESIQSHRRIIWIFAGSLDITELTHAAWPSYLISARTIEVPLFTLPETTLLLTEPMRHSLLWTPGDPKRPRFDAALWGDRGIERVHAEASGWPHLVQLIAETIVDLLNQGTARHADPALIE